MKRVVDQIANESIDTGINIDTIIAIIAGVVVLRGHDFARTLIKAIHLQIEQTTGVMNYI